MQGRTVQGLQRSTAYFSGRVQGVGFRYTCRNIAVQYDMRGYVRNLPDGRVELVIEGPGCQTEELISAVQQRMGGFIKNIDLLFANP